jgi:hypothetical protein
MKSNSPQVFLESSIFVLLSILTDETLEFHPYFGERDIVRRPFMFPIPRFNPNNSVHLGLAELSKICHEKVAKVKFTGKSVASLRKQAREAVKGELKEIDELVSNYYK